MFGQAAELMAYVPLLNVQTYSGGLKNPCVMEANMPLLPSSMLVCDINCAHKRKRMHTRAHTHKHTRNHTHLIMHKRAPRAHIHTCTYELRHTVPGLNLPST